MQHEFCKKVRVENRRYNGYVVEDMRYMVIRDDGTHFFIDGNDAFTKISEDTNFYIDSFDRLVIVFDEYEVAPGSMGNPEFFINNSVIKDIVR